MRREPITTNSNSAHVINELNTRAAREQPGESFAALIAKQNKDSFFPKVNKDCNEATTKRHANYVERERERDRQ